MQAQKRIGFLTMLGAGSVLLVGCATSPYSSFDELDDDSDGNLSCAEAEVRTDVMANWRWLDRNKDDQLDVTEFSAFEARKGFAPPGGSYRGY